MTYIVPPPSAATPPPTPEPPSITMRGRDLVVPKNYAFPPICLVTGRTDDLVAVRRKLSWHSPALYLLIFAGVLIYVIVAAVASKRSEHTFFLTREERSRRRKWTAIGWLTLLAALGCLVAGAALDTPGIIIGFPLLLIAAIVIFYTKVQLLRPERISDTTASIRGIAPAVMSQLVNGIPAA